MTKKYEQFDNFFTGFKKLNIKDKEFIQFRMNNILKTTEFSSNHCFGVLNSMSNIATQYGIDLYNSNILEIGSGKYSLLTGLYWKYMNVKKYIGIDKFCNPFLSKDWEEMYKSKINLLPRILGNKDLYEILDNDSWNKLNEFIEIYKDDFLNIKLKENTFDFVYSSAVFEHIEKPEDTISALYNVLKPGGLTYHNIDLRPHSAHKQNPIDILRYSTTDWKAKTLNSYNWQYLNRLRSSDWIELFETNGFEILDVKIRKFEEVSTDDIYNHIDDEFKGYSLDVLNNAIVNITARKI